MGRLGYDAHPVAGSRTSTIPRAAVRRWGHSSSSSYPRSEDRDDSTMATIVGYIQRRIGGPIVSWLTLNCGQREKMESWTLSQITASGGYLQRFQLEDDMIVAYAAQVIRELKKAKKLGEATQWHRYVGCLTARLFPLQ